MSRQLTNYELILSNEAGFIQSELADTLKPNILLAELSQLILQMLIEYTEYISKNKETDKLKLSKIRLLKLLSISVDLNGIGDLSQKLKLSNHSIMAENITLKALNKELENKLSNINSAFNAS